MRASRRWPTYGPHAVSICPCLSTSDLWRAPILSFWSDVRNEELAKYVGEGVWKGSFRCLLYLREGEEHYALWKRDRKLDILQFRSVFKGPDGRPIGLYRHIHILDGKFADPDFRLSPEDTERVKKQDLKKPDL